MKRVVILGAGTAGTMMANKLLRALPEGWTVTVIDRDDRHIYQPGLLFLPFGDYRREEIIRPRHLLLPDGVELLLSPIERVEPDRKRVVLAGGEVVDYTLLIIATGTRVMPEETPGMTGPGWRESAFDFYTLDGASALGAALEDWEGGHLVLNVAEMPIKCPVAPLEFLFLADAFFTERGMRDKVKITYASPLDSAFTKPVAAAALGDLLRRRDIHFVGDFVLSEVRGEDREILSYDGRSLGYDLLVSVPIHGGSAVIGRSELGDDMGFVPTDRHTLRSEHFEDIFVLGDATNLPSSKAGSVAHFQAEVLAENVLRWVEDRPLNPGFDGHANCFIETGFGKAILIDFNYETEPLPGRFPRPGIGPFTLLEESYVNHWGKLGFKWTYWNVLMRGEELPIDHRMLMAGKRRV